MAIDRKVCDLGMMVDSESSLESQPAPSAQAMQGYVDAMFRPQSAEEELLEGPGQFFALAAEVARGQFNPAVQWDGFVQALWEQVDAGFGLSADDEDYSSVPRAWFDEPNDPDVVVWNLRPEAG